MNLYAINNGNFMLDGGAMFGVVPKSIWSRTNPTDANNMCPWSMRSLLIEDGNRLILIDCGMGDKQSEKFYGYYFLHGDDSLDKGLKAHGFHRDDITDVFLTHLHFDHCGGAIRLEGEKFVPAFRNARFWSNDLHWKWATEPNKREKASFLSENILPIKESGQLEMIEKTGRFSKSPFEDIDLFFADGHTEAQMIPLITYKDKKIAFMADLLPSTGHIPLPYVMGYDTRPLLTLDEKELFLTKAADEEIILYLEHDSMTECCTVKHTEKGVRLDQTFKLSEI
ncbi:MAG: MBL fold metallo-hydrolase [Flavobacteriales bacterium]|jgi:glyoxylase-like metal-dependent hydrolase (beta-lactamase superfamily II)|tara:strand:- start:3062 stop:3907 length:846 start_codon:yes stop_codon:yes gene_type:complete